jgi:hypothetical protein
MFKNKKIQLIIFVGLIITIGLFCSFNIQSVSATYEWTPMQEIPTTSVQRSFRIGLGAFKLAYSLDNKSGLHHRPDRRFLINL